MPVLIIIPSGGIAKHSGMQASGVHLLLLPCQQTPTHLRHTQRATPMTFLVAQAPGSHLGIDPKHPSEFENASCCNGRRAAPLAGANSRTSVMSRTAQLGMASATNAKC
jgi:hypothetical protein